jgi:hypothetical protein
VSGCSRGDGVESPKATNGIAIELRFMEMELSEMETSRLASRDF